MCSARFAGKWTLSDCSVVTPAPLGGRGAKEKLSPLTVLLTAAFIQQQHFIGEEVEMPPGADI